MSSIKQENLTDLEKDNIDFPDYVDSIREIPEDKSVSQETREKTALYIFLTVLFVILIFLLSRLCS